jgi:hypothetical protein
MGTISLGLDFYFAIRNTIQQEGVVGWAFSGSVCSLP